jgi:diacylglycerol kinase (ATP)
VNNEFSKVLFIVNKFSGGAYDPRVDGKILSACERRGIEAKIEFTRARGHATELSHQAVNDNNFDLIVAVGGDGTVNEVAQGMLHSDLKMGILPKGSGNGLARHLGIPMKISESIQTLFDSQAVGMDTFTVNGKLSLNVSGIGFDGHVANLFANHTKRGFQGYASVTVNEFIQFKEFEAEIITENKSEKRNTFIIAVANSSQYGNNARIAPAASVCDEILHVCFLKKVPPYRLDFVYSFFAGTIQDNAFCEYIETRNMTIKLSSPMAYHVDGEPCGVEKEFTIALLPHSLKVLVPKSSLRY